MARYKKHHNGDRVIPRMSGYKMACCDCNLVHKIDFEVMVAKPTTAGRFTLTKPRNKHRLQVILVPSRDNRATAALRRQRKV